LSINQVQSTYDSVADEYAQKFFHELDHKPLDRLLLDIFCERVAGSGSVCEVGCGPGEISVYLKNRGIDVYGVDISERMIQTATRLSPGIRFETGDMRSLRAESNSLAGIVGFYAIVNLSRPEVETAFAEFHRTLRVSAPLLLSFHVGNEKLSMSEFLGKPVSLDLYLYPVDAIKAMLAGVGFHVGEVIVRSPHETIEYPSQRAYVFARKAGRS